MAAPKRLCCPCSLRQRTCNKSPLRRDAVCTSTVSWTASFAPEIITSRAVSGMSCARDLRSAARRLESVPAVSTALESSHARVVLDAVSTSQMCSASMCGEHK